MSELNFAKTFLQAVDAKGTKYQPDHVFDPKTFETRIPFTLPKLPQPPHPPYPKTTPSTPPPPGATPTTTSTTSSSTITLILKSARNPFLTLTLSSINPTTTTIPHLREAIQKELGGPTVVAADKIKILYHKKPVPASKRTVGDVLEGESLGKQEAGEGENGGRKVELGVMIIGGVADVKAKDVASVVAGAGAAAESGGGGDVSQSPVVTGEAGQGQPEPMEGVEKVSSAVQGPSGKEIMSTEEFWSDLQGYLEQRIKDEVEAERLVRKWRGGGG